MGLYLTLAGIYVGASLIQGLTSFGFAVISVPLVAALTNPTTAIAYNVAIATAVSLQKAIMLRKKLNVKWTVLFYLAVLPFIAPGVIFISRLPREAALVSMGVYVVIAAALQLAHYGSFVGRAMRTRTAYGITAVLTGLLSGAFSTPGPSSVPFFLSRHEDPLAGQANLSLFFSMLIAPVLGLHILVGELQPVEIIYGLPYIPVAMVATFFATRWATKLNAGILRRIVAVAMIMMGVYLVVSSLIKP